MLHQNRQALVVEGGGMRGAFTSGVLDAFLQQQFNPFDLCVGVSSGSTNVANYLAAQQGRTLQIYLDHPFALNLSITVASLKAVIYWI